MMLTIPAGSVQLEAQLREPERNLRGAVIVCHPHPVYGGTMDNRVVYRAAKAVLRAGFAALRFNFRGVGKSSGQYDYGVGEKEDVAAAADWIEQKYPGIPLSLIGYSFGAWVGLQVGCSDPRISAVIGLGLPLDTSDLSFLSECSKPALYIVGTRDEFCSPENLEDLERRLPCTSTIHRIKDADHFFTSQIETVENLIESFFQNLSLERSSA
jgi:uncharacterized protein